MGKKTTWVAECHLQDRKADEGDVVQDYECLVAVWADGYDGFRHQLIEHLERTPYRLLWVEECFQAVEYVKKHGQQAKVGSLSRQVHSAHRVEIGPVLSKGQFEDESQSISFKEALLALDYKASPVFAVLDGAQFDNLPKALFDGDFVSRPLYLDRGDNDAEQIITAPHMVILDERSEKVTGRSYQETLEALLVLIDDKPAAVFWQCPSGADELYRHLRKINMVTLPASALPNDEQQFVEIESVITLFRHADANVLAQVIFSMTKLEAAHLFGPACRLLFKPDEIWQDKTNYLAINRLESWPFPQSGMLCLTSRTIKRMEKIREDGMKKWVISDFIVSNSNQNTEKKFKQILNAFSRADNYLFEKKDDIWSFITLDLKYGPEFEHRPEFVDVYDELTYMKRTAQQRLYYAQQLLLELDGR